MAVVTGFFANFKIEPNENAELYRLKVLNSVEQKYQIVPIDIAKLKKHVIIIEVNKKMMLKKSLSDLCGDFMILTVKSCADFMQKNG